MQGFYSDRSSFVKTYHHVKLNARSPSFEDTTLDASYVRDEHEFKIDGQVEYGVVPYGITFRNTQNTKIEKISYAEIKWRKQLYWLAANLTSGQPKQLTVDLHIDK